MSSVRSNRGRHTRLHCNDSNTHGVLVLVMFCSWKRLSQWVCNIQIGMYFGNLYVSLLDLIANGIEASLDVFGSLVKSGFLRQGNCSSIVTKDFHWIRCTRYYTYIGYELLHPDSFICCF